MTEVRTFIDKLSQSGMVYWKKGVTLSVDRIECCEPTYNVILSNMIACYIGGSAKMTFDTNTQRWQAATLWNKYTGIPNFDKYSGGSFLTFGLRSLDPGSLSETDSAMCLPIAFAPALNNQSSRCLAITRLGLQVEIKGIEVEKAFWQNKGFMVRWVVYSTIKLFFKMLCFL